MKRDKIIFNQFPPVYPEDPDVSFPILQGFLQRSNISSRIIYWNILFYFLYEEFFHLTTQKHKRIIPKDYLFLLSPFLLMMLEEEKNEENIRTGSRLKKSLISLCREKSNDMPFPDNALEQFGNQLLSFTRSELKKINFDDLLIWGISFKCNQWIPGMIVTGLLRQLSSGFAVVAGGFSSEEQARVFMDKFEDIDFAVWGEGEYPLLGLIEQLSSHSNNFNSIPGLLFRDKGRIISSKKREKKAVSPGADSYGDYFSAALKAGIDLKDAKISYNSIRGCLWAKCRFCVLHQQYDYQEKEPESIIKELRHFKNKYNINHIHFADQNITGKNPERFEKLLDLLILMRSKEKNFFHLTGDIMPIGLDSETIMKMSMAGFYLVLIGYEANCDSLLKKMNKAHRFAHNIHFLKFAREYGIKVVANLLQGIPGEKEEEVRENIENLNFLRFFLSVTTFRLEQMRLCAGSPYEREMTQEEKRDKWNIDDDYTVYSYLPEAFKDERNRLYLGSYISSLENEIPWLLFKTALGEYKKANMDYRVYFYGDSLGIKEFSSGNLTADYLLSPLETRLLLLANDRIQSIYELHRQVTGFFPEITQDEVKELLRGLQSKYILYSDEEFENIISVVNVRQILNSERY